EVSFPVTYKGHGVGEYFADNLVEDVLVIELKCAERLSNEHTAQSQLLASLGPNSVSARQLPETQGRPEAAHQSWPRSSSSRPSASPAFGLPS
ncbi:MAG: GxxExxY protein, partial [Acidobacteria bacterium]|nr:GxxExxY protein [Acidobacteriota bacterium]